MTSDGKAKEKEGFAVGDGGWGMGECQSQSRRFLGCPSLILSAEGPCLIGNGAPPPRWGRARLVHGLSGACG